MSKLNIFTSTSFFKLLLLFYLFIVLVSAKSVDRSSADDAGSSEDESKQFFLPEAFLPSKDDNSRIERSPAARDYHAPYRQLGMPLFKRHTIPIELQKALYAHGIVGRRR